MEEHLHPTRCVEIKKGRSDFRGSSFQITPEMIEAPAFKVGEEVEARDSDDDAWGDYIFGGHVFRKESLFKFVTSGGANWKQCRRKPKSTIEITIKINGVEAKLSDISDETLAKIKRAENI